MRSAILVPLAFLFGLSSCVRPPSDKEPSSLDAAGKPANPNESGRDLPLCTSVEHFVQFAGTPIRVAGKYIADPSTGLVQITLMDNTVVRMGETARSSQEISTYDGKDILVRGVPAKLPEAPPSEQPRAALDLLLGEPADLRLAQD